MRPPPPPARPRRSACACVGLGVSAALLACGAARSGPSLDHPECDRDNGGITLPAGFCAALLPPRSGVARHAVVGPDGIVSLALEPGSRTSAGTSRRREPGGGWC